MKHTSIKSVRLALGLSQAQFAKILGVHTLRISKWERGAAALKGVARELLLALERGINKAPLDVEEEKAVKDVLARSGEGERLEGLLNILFGKKRRGLRDSSAPNPSGRGNEKKQKEKDFDPFEE